MEEKMEHFQSFCIEDARTRSAKMLDEYTTALEKTFTKHQADARRRADMQLEAETTKLKREFNKQLSLEQINLKRMLGQKQQELKDMLFVEIKDMLEHFMETEEYLKLLEVQINHAKEVAGDEPFIVYLDSVDENKARKLAAYHNVDVRISDSSFSGGTKVMIPSKNILIDNSFQSKLVKARETAGGMGS